MKNFSSLDDRCVSERPRISKVLLLRISETESFLLDWVRPLIFKEAIFMGKEIYSGTGEGSNTEWFEDWFKEGSQVCSNGMFVDDG